MFSNPSLASEARAEEAAQCLVGRERGVPSRKASSKARVTRSEKERCAVT
jgi:hypothetical protein